MLASQSFRVNSWQAFYPLAQTKGSPTHSYWETTHSLERQNQYLFFGLFFLYGIYASATEGISKAWISNITDKRDTATAIGTFTGLQSICTMLASSITGLIWYSLGAKVAFMLTAGVTVIVIIYFLTVPKPEYFASPEIS